MPPRTIAIGDVHGCVRALDALLAAVDPAPQDTIVTLGDYIDRGPDSRGVLDRLIALESRCRLIPILGNHDEMLLAVRRGEYPVYWLLDIGGVATLKSYGGRDRPRDLDLIPAPHYAFLERCRDFFEDASHIFTHANYEPDLPMSEQPVGTLRWESLRDTTPGPHVSGKTFVVGHTSQKSGEVLDLGHLICVDTYCYGGGWLTALDVGSRQVWQANAKGRIRSA